MSLNEHAAILSDDLDSKQCQRKKAGQGVHLITANVSGTLKAKAYKFDAKQYTPESAKEWLDKAEVSYTSFEPALLEASNPDGKVWGSGLHYVWVNDKPARVWVPEDTVLDTFQGMKSRISKEGSIGLGIDHLNDNLLDDNEILKKLNLLDVGEVSEIVTDGDGIYIKDSTLHNDLIASLHDDNQLPAYSVVGSMDARPCPNGKADYILKSLDVERVDFVEEGGCTSCKVGVQPEGLILTAKLNTKQEDDNMDAVNETNPVVEEVPNAVETVTPENVEAPTEDMVETTEEIQEDVEVEPEQVVSEETVTVDEEEPSTEEILKQMREEIESLKNENKELGSKKPKPNDAFNAEEEVTKLIKAGYALPKQKESLLVIANLSEEAFRLHAKSLPKIVTLETKAKLAKKEDKAPPKTPTWDEEYGDMAKHFRI